VTDDDYHVPGNSKLFWPGTFIDSATKSGAGVSVKTLPNDLAGGPPSGSQGMFVTLPKTTTTSDYLINVSVRNKITGDGSDTDAGLTLYVWADKALVGNSTQSVTQASVKEWVVQVGYSSTVRVSSSASTLYFALQNLAPPSSGVSSAANTLDLNAHSTYVNITEIVGEATIA